jgi:hypothetical protein
METEAIVRLPRLETIADELVPRANLDQAIATHDARVSSLAVANASLIIAASLGILSAYFGYAFLFLKVTRPIEIVVAMVTAGLCLVTGYGCGSFLREFGESVVAFKRASVTSAVKAAALEECSFLEAVTFLNADIRTWNSAAELAERAEVDGRALRLLAARRDLLDEARSKALLIARSKAS